MSEPKSAPKAAKGLGSVDMTQGPVFGHLLRFTLPISAGIFANMVVGLIDIYWLGRLGVTEQAAASLGFPIGVAVYSIATGLGAGTIAAVGPAVSAGDQTQVRALAMNAILLGALSIGVVSFLGALSIFGIFGLMGAEGDLQTLATEYMQIWFFGIVFLAIASVGSSVLRAMGQALAPSLIVVSTAVINLVLDPILIFGWGPIPAMGVAGAAWATAVANMIALALLAYLMIVRARVIVAQFSPWPIIREHWIKITRVGVPAIGSNMINPLSIFVVSVIFTRMGEEALAGFGIAYRIEAFVMIPLFAMSAAIAPVVGQNLGAGRMDRIRDTFRESFKFAIFYSVGCALFLAVTGSLIAGQFSDNEVVKRVAWISLLVLPISFWGYGATFIAAAGLNGLSRPLPGLAMTVTRSIGLYAVGAILGSILGGATGAFVGMALANVVAGVFVIWWILARAYPPTEAGASGPSDMAQTSKAL